MKVKEFVDSINENLAARFQNSVDDVNGPYRDEYSVIHQLIEPTLKDILKGEELPFSCHLVKSTNYTVQFNFSQNADPCQLMKSEVIRSCLYLSFHRKKHNSGREFYPCFVEIELLGHSRPLPAAVEEMEVKDILVFAYEDMFSIHLKEKASELIRLTNSLVYLDAHNITDIDEFLEQTQGLLAGSSFLTLSQPISVSPSWSTQFYDGIRVPFVLLPKALKRLFAYIEQYFKQHPAPIFGEEQMQELLAAKRKVNLLSQRMNGPVYIGISNHYQAESIKLSLDKLAAHVKHPQPETDDDLYMESCLLQMQYSGATKLTGANVNEMKTCEELRKAVKGPGVWYAYDRTSPPVFLSGKFENGNDIPYLKNAIVVVLSGGFESETHPC